MEENMILDESLIVEEVKEEIHEEVIQAELRILIAYTMNMGV